MMKLQIETLYQILYKIEAEKNHCPLRSYEYIKLEKEESALKCAIFELENS